MIELAAQGWRCECGAYALIRGHWCERDGADWRDAAPEAVSEEHREGRCVKGKEGKG